MSFSPPRHHPVALSLVCALTLLLGACATTGDGSGQRNPGAPSLIAPWEIVGGGVQGENFVTGPMDIRFIRPVAVSARGHLVYIVDLGHRQLFRYDTRIGRMIPFLDLQGVIHSDEADLHLNPDLSFFIADPDGGRVLYYDRAGNLIQVIEDRVNLARPVAVAANDLTGYIFIADGFNDHVLVYNPAGLLEGGFGARGRGPGRFQGIMALSQGPEGYYVATRFGAHRVQVMDFNGRYLRSFEKDTVTFPTAIAVSPDNRIFVADYMSDDIKVFEGGELVDVIGGHGSGPGRFRRIMDLWINDGFLYVADSLNGRIQIIALAALDLAPEVELPLDVPLEEFEELDEEPLK